MYISSTVMDIIMRFFVDLGPREDLTHLVGIGHIRCWRGWVGVWVGW